jgi:hypothetical protein
LCEVVELTHVISARPGCALPHCHCVEGETQPLLQSGEQEMVRRKAVCGYKHALSAQIVVGQRGHQHVQTLRDVLAGRRRCLGGADQLAPQVDELLALTEKIAPLVVVRTAPDRREFDHRRREIRCLAGILADRMIEEIAIVLSGHMRSREDVCRTSFGGEPGTDRSDVYDFGLASPSLFKN